MNQDLKKFEELLKTNEAFREKLKVATEKFEGNLSDEKAIFDGIIVPIAKEEGLEATFEEFKAYMEDSANRSQDAAKDLGMEELAQVSGGAKGLGGMLCAGIGLGLGGGSGKGAGGGCILAGAGWGAVACYEEGDSLDPLEEDPRK